MSPTTVAGTAEIGGSLLFRLVRAISIMECEETRCCGVTMGQCLALLALDASGQTSMSEITAALGVSAGTATRVVDNLVRDGLAQRDQDPVDRRKVYVRPTQQGVERIAQLKECYRRFWEDVFGHMPQAKLDAALDALGALAEAVEMAKASCCESQCNTRLNEEAPL